MLLAGRLPDFFHQATVVRPDSYPLPVVEGPRQVRDPLKTIRLVYLTAAYGRKTIPYNPKVKLVGGKIDAAKLKRGGSVSWIQRKRNCPAE